jgi:hypothetical protein
MVALTVTVAPAIPDNAPLDVTVGSGKTSSSFWQEENARETTERTAINLNNLFVKSFIGL